jgi:hypothetical protein
MRIAVLPAEGPVIASEADALYLVAEHIGDPPDWIVIPKQRLAPDFFRLRSGLLGAVTQKFVNYRLRVAVLGDVSAEIAASDAFRDFVRETNKGRHFRFVTDVGELGGQGATPG